MEGVHCFADFKIFGGGDVTEHGGAKYDIIVESQPNNRQHINFKELCIFCVFLRLRWGREGVYKYIYSDIHVSKAPCCY